MALYTEQSARACVRVKDGKRVFYLGDGDRLTPAARSWLRLEGIAILPAAAAKPTQYRTLFGAQLTEKPEHMTHLRENILVFKDHPRIALRGGIDTLEAELLLCQQQALQAGQQELNGQLQEILDAVRHLIRCDVLDEPLEQTALCGLTAAQLREHSHNPQKYYGQPHFMPSVSDGPVLLQLNRLRTCVRDCELRAYRAYRTPDGAVTREDILMFLNRLSSLIWILMIRQKAAQAGKEAP